MACGRRQGEKQMAVVSGSARVALDLVSFSHFLTSVELSGPSANVLSMSKESRRAANACCLAL